MAGGLIRGEVRLAQFPAPDKTRPVLVLTRDTALPYLTRVTVAPITSSMRGVPSEVHLGPEDGLKQACAINLHNVLTVRKAIVGRRICQLSQSRMEEVCAALRFALGCES